MQINYRVEEYPSRLHVQSKAGPLTLTGHLPTCPDGEVEGGREKKKEKKENRGRGACVEESRVWGSLR